MERLRLQSRARGRIIASQAEPAVDLAQSWKLAVRFGRRLIGVPDYDTYVAHLRAHHPERPVPDYAEFFRERQQARYRGGGGRCC
jgi:uncharacterized short protein YbdD (DUF466 family)